MSCGRHQRRPSGGWWLMGDVNFRWIQGGGLGDVPERFERCNKGMINSLIELLESKLHHTAEG